MGITETEELWEHTENIWIYERGNNKKIQKITK
jgi:hypothetical protein